MAITRRDSRSRVGILWFDNEPEADEYAATLSVKYGSEAIANANLGIIQVGRDRAFDLPGEYAVVTP